MAEEIVTEQTNNVGVVDTNSDEGLAALDLFTKYPSYFLDFAAISCTVFMIIGIPGNLFTIISLARYKKVRNATAVFIINLSMSDLLFCCINLPLAISTFWTRKWLHGVFMCKFFVFARFALSGVAIFTVLAITINRYIMMFHDKIYRKLYSPRNLCIHVACIWICAVLSLIPTWAEAWGCFGMDTESSFCVILPDDHENTPMKLLFVTAFVIPFVAICICYGRIFFVARKATAKSRGNVQTGNSLYKEDSSFATSTVAQPDNENDQGWQNPRVQSLRAPSTPRIKISILTDERTSAISTSNFNFSRALNLRKSQILNIAPTPRDKRLLTMISAIMITFFVFHLPITIIKASHAISEYSPMVIIWSYLLRYLTTCINPIIYVAMSQEYRKAYKKLLVPRSCKDKFCLPR